MNGDAARMPLPALLGMHRHQAFSENKWHQRLLMSRQNREQ